MPGLAVTGGDHDPPRQTDHILTAGGSVPAILKVRKGFADHDAGSRQAFRQFAGGRLLCPLDLDVAKMGLTIVEVLLFAANPEPPKAAITRFTRKPRRHGQGSTVES